jgi:hypothetical protein
VTDIIRIVDGLDLVVEMADGVIHPDDVDTARRVVRRVRDRSGYWGATLVMALAGGTGSGKSSLLNALAGERVAPVSPVRPHTRRPLAWVPSGAEPGLADLLDRLGIHDRVEHDRFPGLALLDVTDVDSIERDHRTRVEALLPEVDGVVWVLDPEKYGDPLLHDQFIAPLADSVDQFLFVLNQVDRLEPQQRTIVAEDLRAVLRRDGIDDPIIFYVAADPPDGPRRGIADLAAYLERRLDAKRVQLAAMISEARRTARSLAGAAGIRGGGSLAFEERWSEFLDQAVTRLAIGEPGLGAFEEVLYGLEDLVGHLAAEAGGPFGMKLRAVFTDGMLARALRAAVDRVDAEVPRPPGGAIEPERRADAAGLLADELQERVAAPLRRVLWARAALAASLAGLAVDVAGVEEGLPSP